jgi:hypothetical protein
MTIKKASTSEIARAVKHSMVVIDAEKHNLNYRLSAKNNGISALKAKYQGGPRSGASTLISRAGSQTRLPKQTPRAAKDGGPIDRETGKRVFTKTDESYVDKSGKQRDSITKVKALAATDDAYTLVSAPTGTAMERVYAEHSNKLKALGNKARKESVNTPRIKYSSSAAKVYKAEADSLSNKLALAKMNAPYERQAQLVANATYKAKLKSDPNMDDTQKKKIKAQALNEARLRLGAKKESIWIEDREWDAIQQGAISDTKLGEILNNADIDRVKELATPRPKKIMSSAKTARAQRMLRSGATRAEVAAALGVSITTLDEVTNAEGGRFLDG